MLSGAKHLIFAFQERDSSAFGLRMTFRISVLGPKARTNFSGVKLFGSNP